MERLLEVQNLRVAFNTDGVRYPVLRGVDLSLDRDEVPHWWVKAVAVNH